MTSPSPALLATGQKLVVDGRETEIVARKGADAKPVIRLGLTANRSAVEALRGAELIVPDAAAPPLGEDEYWAEQLVGCAVADGDRSLGVVTALLGLPSCEVLELDTGLLVPLVRDAIRTVDIDARRIDVDAGFLGAA